MVYQLLTTYFMLHNAARKERISMKKEYSPLEMEVIVFEQADVLTASGVEKEPEPPVIN